MKQAIVIRNDLKMEKGKIAAQAAHASIDAFLKAKKKDRDEWLEDGMKKVVLKVESEKELIEIFNKAKEMDLPCSLIRDKGLTQIPSGTKTSVGIGPADDEEIDEITGHLKLL